MDTSKDSGPMEEGEFDEQEHIAADADADADADAGSGSESAEAADLLPMAIIDRKGNSDYRTRPYAGISEEDHTEGFDTTRPNVLDPDLKVQTALPDPGFQVTGALPNPAGDREDERIVSGNDSEAEAGSSSGDSSDFDFGAVEDQMDDGSSASSEGEDELPSSRLTLAEREKILIAGDEDEHGRSGGILRTKNELEKLPPVEDLSHISVPADLPLVPVGMVYAIVDDLVVVEAQASGDIQVLDMGSVLLLEDRSVLGKVFDTFGPVARPMYSIRFNSALDIDRERIKVGQSVFCVPDLVHYVFTQVLTKMKGSDASNIFDEEVGDDEREFSDDEEEMEYRRLQKKKKLDTKTEVAASSDGEPYQLLSRPLPSRPLPPARDGSVGESDRAAMRLQGPPRDGFGAPGSRGALRGRGTRGGSHDEPRSRGGPPRHSNRRAEPSAALNDDEPGSRVERGRGRGRGTRGHLGHGQRSYYQESRPLRADYEFDGSSLPQDQFGGTHHHPRHNARHFPGAAGHEVHQGPGMLGYGMYPPSSVGTAQPMPGGAGHGAPSLGQMPAMGMPAIAETAQSNFNLLQVASLLSTLQQNQLQTLIRSAGLSMQPGMLLPSPAPVGMPYGFGPSQGHPGAANPPPALAGPGSQPYGNGAGLAHGGGVLPGSGQGSQGPGSDYQQNAIMQLQQQHFQRQFRPQ
ncbi:Gar1/Naf1 RNA binding region-domain-containing protein [Polychytrium aggregatum]|uniref:Gar1/Naf1 RNA binding region-domain-containing protein n=1 Tax=Polychytrium aggregatum TaxID=110093 RepID=UPI0022FDF271|nr:Gar1/Naf1 RNA binding region-domain-containing protein [Polychytrium aggregatum]KAI9193380.1 Gar1/Naf1 RNA binding region-domain-containing protein [Polychytrium aggregatum]